MSSLDTALIHDEREGVYGGDGDADGDDGCDGDADDDNKMRLGLLPEAILIKTIVYGFSLFSGRGILHLVQLVSGLPSRGIFRKHLL